MCIYIIYIYIHTRVYYTIIITSPCCPAWAEPGKKVEGNPDYFYNFMMEGLKSFTCSTCLLKFLCGLLVCPNVSTKDCKART